jgi:hypothetical protein
VTRIGRRAIMTMVLIVAFTLLWICSVIRARAKAAHATKRDRSA